MAENPNWKRFIQRKIQLDIVTIFIFLLLTSSFIVIFYIYNRNYKNILDLSTVIVGQVKEVVVEKITGVTNDTLLLSEATKGFITDGKTVSNKNQKLISYLINSLKIDPLIYSVNIATDDGNFLSVTNLTLAQLYYYYSDPTKPLPEGAKYAIRMINNNLSPATETWEYLDTDTKLLDTETIAPVSYDPRTDIWFQAIHAWPRIRWDNVDLPRGANKYMTNRASGITVSVPVVNAEDKFVAVIGINTAIKELSNFISHQKIGISGKAFVLDDNGHILIPSENSDPSEISTELVEHALAQFNKTQQNSFLLPYNNIDYLVTFSEFPLALENTWTIMVVVPFHDFFGNVIQTQKQTIFISFGIMIVFSVLIYFASRHISVPIIQLAKDVDRICHFDFSTPKKIDSHIVEIKTLESSISAMREAIRSFGRYIPKDIVKALVAKGKEITLGGERRSITLMFSDIFNFTTYSESLPIEKLTPFLTAYFDRLSKIILETEGTIDKYIGDSIMVFWGAPHDVDDQEAKACITALRCLSSCQKMQKENPTENWLSRFGLHCGEAIVGNIGTTERMNYTVMGDTVNTAARLQELNKQYHTSIIISETVQKKIGVKFISRPLDYLAVKGKTIKILIYELAGTAEGEFACSTEQVDLCKEFTIAYELFRQGKLEEAKKLFLSLQQRFPSDKPIQIYLERIALL